MSEQTDDYMSIHDEWVDRHFKEVAARKEKFLVSSLGEFKRARRARLLGRLPFGCSLAWHNWAVFEQSSGFEWTPYWLECRRCHVKIHPQEVKL